MPGEEPFRREFKRTEKSSNLRLEFLNLKSGMGADGKSSNGGSGMLKRGSFKVFHLKRSRVDLSHFKLTWQFISQTFFPTSYKFFENDLKAFLIFHRFAFFYSFLHV